MDKSLIFASIGFMFFVGGVLFYLISESKAQKAEWSAILAQKSEINFIKNKSEENTKRLNSNQIEIGLVKESINTLHDHYSKLITIHREAEIRRAETERQVNQLKPLFPSKIEFILDSKIKESMPESDRKGGQDEKETRKENKKSSRARGRALGQSYRDVARSNSSRVQAHR